MYFTENKLGPGVSRSDREQLTLNPRSGIPSLIILLTGVTVISNPVQMKSRKSLPR